MPGMGMGGRTTTAAGTELPTSRTSGVTRMGALVMPPGMIMTSDMSMDAMRGMAAVDPSDVDARAAVDARGDRPLAPRTAGAG